ncbi:MAG: hypothetical protein QXP70_04850 [Methanomassiliicoccales archaeon]
MSEIQNDEDINETSYLKQFASNPSLVVETVLRGFSVFGYRRNVSTLWNSFSRGYDCFDDKRLSAIRLLHSAFHSGSLLEGRETLLPAVRAALFFSKLPQRRYDTMPASSLNLSQLEFEFISAAESDAWGRVASVAAEIASRGETSLLIDLSRSILLRRNLLSSPSLSALSAVNCALRFDDSLTSSVALPLASTFSVSSPSGEIAQIRRYLSRDGMDPERIASNTFVPDKAEDKKVREALSSSLPELFLKIAIGQLKDGVSPVHLLELEAETALLHFHSTPDHASVSPITEVATSMLEINSFNPFSVFAVYDSLLLGMLICGLPSAKFSTSSHNGSIHELLLHLEHGNPAPLISFIRKESKEQDLLFIRHRLSSLAYKCDPTSANEDVPAHVFQVLFPSFGRGIQLKRGALLEATIGVALVISGKCTTAIRDDVIAANNRSTDDDVQG